MKAIVSSVLSSARKLAAATQRSTSDPCDRIGDDDLNQLATTVERIQAALREVEERETVDRSAKLWLKELRDIAREAEHVLHVSHHTKLRPPKAEAGPAAAASHKRKFMEEDDDDETFHGMRDRIRQITRRFDETSREWEALHLKEEHGERQVDVTKTPPPTSHLLLDESGVYGREHDKQSLVDLLLSHEEEDKRSTISVLPIVGERGVGKTTVAQLAYNDPRVRRHFDLRGWVFVSKDLSVASLMKATIESLARRPCNLTEVSRLQESLKQELEERRVLLVLDNALSERRDFWEPLHASFVGAETVRVVVTTRNASAVEFMRTLTPAYHLGRLPHDQCWLLFQHYAFGGREPSDQPNLAEIGKQIVEKCGGLPSAVKTLAGLLRCETDEACWRDTILRSEMLGFDE